MTPRPAAAAEASRLGGEIETGIVESRVWGSAKARRAVRAGPEDVLK